MESVLCVHTYLSVFSHFRNVRIGNRHTISFSTKHNRDGDCKTRSKLSGIFPRWKGVRGVIPKNYLGKIKEKWKPTGLVEKHQ